VCNSRVPPLVLSSFPTRRSSDLGTVSNPFLLGLSAIGLVAIIVVVQWAARHPDKVEGALLSVLSWINARRRKPADTGAAGVRKRSEEHTSELQSRFDLVCRLLLE